jgi:hypothetical protein
VDRRNENGVKVAGTWPITFRDGSVRTVNIEALKNQFAPAMQDARGISLHLEQRPYVQIFLDTEDESTGSVPPPLGLQVALRNGRLFTLEFATQALFHVND